VVVVRPDGRAVTGKGSETPGSDSLVTDYVGGFTYEYLTASTEGLWTVSTYYSTDTEHAMVLATTTFVTYDEGSGPAVASDKPDYQPGETAVIYGSRLQPDASYDVPVIRPDGAIMTGDGTGTSGWDTVTADSVGHFAYNYQLDGIQGLYTLEVYPSPWGGPGSGEVPLATATFSDCPYWRTEDDMRNSPWGCRTGFVLDPSPGNFISRGYFLANADLFNPHGWSMNFLWYAPEITIDIPWYSGHWWSYCDNSVWNEPRCPVNSIIEPGAPVRDAFHQQYTHWTVTIHVLWFDGAFIGTVCGNYNPERRNPVPKISGYKFLDQNWNGVHDPGEPGLGGWTIVLQAPDGRQFSAVTDGGGFYRFFLDGLPPGSYTLTEIEQPGWVRTTPQTRTVFVNYGVGDTEFGWNDFGNYQPGHIVIDKVTDPSGSPQSFDFALTGGPSALNQSFSLTDAATPHDSGAVLPGSGYNAAETLPPGWQLTSATCNDGSPVNNIDVAPGETVTCTFTNTLRTAQFVVKKDFIPNSGASVSVSLGCTSGQVSPASGSASEGSPAVFTVTGYEGNPSCTAAESPIPVGYDSSGTCAASLSAGECTITNTLRSAEFDVRKDFIPGSADSVSVSLTCTSGTVVTTPLQASEAAPAVFTIEGFLEGATCTATEVVPAGYIPRPERLPQR
jgi:hypothetical protein